MLVIKKQKLPALHRYIDKVVQVVEEKKHHIGRTRMDLTKVIIMCICMFERGNDAYILQPYAEIFSYLRLKYLEFG